METKTETYGFYKVANKNGHVFARHLPEHEAIEMVNSWKAKGVVLEVTEENEVEKTIRLVTSLQEANFG